MKKCKECSKEIKWRNGIDWKSYFSKRKYCGQECYTKHWKNNILPKLPQFGNDSREVFECYQCKKEFKSYRSNRNKPGQKHLCSKKCWRQYMLENHVKRGSDNSNWNGGTTPKINKRCNSTWWKKLRMKVYKRDNFTCQSCGIKCTVNMDKTKIQCHHLIPGNHDIDKLVTVCLGCHAMLDFVNRKHTLAENYFDYSRGIK